MSSKEEEYKEMFLAEALESYEELNKLFTQLEKDVTSNNAVDAIFRITHTLKGNAMGMGFEAIAELAHVMEDIFSEVKQKNIVLDNELFGSLYKANDKLGELIEALKTGEKVNYKGIRTKLSVYLNNAKKANGLSPEPVAPIAAAPIVVEIPVITENVAPALQPEISASEIPVVNDAPAINITQQELALPIAVQAEIQVSEVSEAIEAAEEVDTPKIAFSDLVQVPVRKLDSLLNLVGELIIERDSLIAKSHERGYGANMFARLQRITSDLQYGVMDVRLVQIGFLFNKFHRIIRDVANIENKKVNLVLEGTEIEIDRNVLKIMSDSLIHVIRNSVSHGIEKPEQRLQKGKSEIGEVILRARNEKDTVIIEVIDDGNGIDHEIIGKKAVKKGIITEEYYKKASKDDLLMLIFEPGFSNAEQITEVSGRGVGMDVVRRATESIGGKIEVKTTIGGGSTIALHLPSSMAVKGALLFELQKQEFAVALTYTEAVISLTKKDIHKISNGLMANYLGRTISVIFLKDLFEKDNMLDFTKEGAFQNTFDSITDLDKKLDVLVVSYANKYCGIVVDKLLQQKEIVEKTLSRPLDNLEMISGATILGNGNVCLVLDIANIINTIFKEKNLHAYGA